MATPTRNFAATTFVVQDGLTLLLWHRKGHAWFPPGGHIEPNELPEEAALREVAEETGLEVELVGARTNWGSVTVLTQPACLLLENIRNDHQHIDLIYFARVTGGDLNIDLGEAADHRWYDAAALAGPEIAPDIRILGRRAIKAVASRRMATA